MDTKIFAGIIVGLWVAIGAMLMVIAIIGLGEVLVNDKWPYKMGVVFLIPFWFLSSALGWLFFQEVIKQQS